MSVNTVAGQVPQLLYSNGRLASRETVFLDFVGLSSKSSKRTRRRLGVASSSSRSTRVGVLGKNWSIRAVLDLERVGTLDKSSSNDLKTQVSFLQFFFNSFLCFL